MLRSCLAVCGAVFVGLFAARGFETVGRTLFSIAVQDRMEYSLLLVAGWALGSGIATAIALLIARRWAPVGIIAGTSLLVVVLPALIEFRASFLLWILAPLTMAAAIAAVIKLMKASFTPPQKPSPTNGLFS